eukprot:TRINITY_DN1817_c0_g5_i1.p1 TRINITY_DN1817_c0_g5~~TRINITY_DN1817_c0_g5_i1.p1  ORF type:complete len:382 (-),score=90.50 TRINITY_DN1817_c0_g5_i1:603-1748(-)
MGAPKQKWNADEEQALRAGVEKYGPGKWRAIQKDPEFGPFLTQRSNVDLKDKWRNMSVAAGSSTVLLIKDKPSPSPTPPKPTREARAAASAAREAIREAEADDDIPMTHDLVPSPPGTRRPSMAQYDEMILTAVAELKEPGGSSIAAICKHAEENNAVPTNFKRILINRVKHLTDNDKLSKNKSNYVLFSPVKEEVAKLPPARLPSKRLRSDLDDIKQRPCSFPADVKKPATSSVPPPLPTPSSLPVDLPSPSMPPPSSRPSRTKVSTTSANDVPPSVTTATTTLAAKVRKPGTINGSNQARREADMAKQKVKSAEEAARYAAQAVQEAEAAAAAAEVAAREAEAAEAEAEAAEAVAANAVAAAAAQSKKKGSTSHKAKPK